MEKLEMPEVWGMVPRPPGVEAEEMGKQGHDMPEEAPSISEVMEEKLPVDEVMEANTSCLNSSFSPITGTSHVTAVWLCVFVCFCVVCFCLCFVFVLFFAFGSLCFGSCSSNVTR